MDDQQVTPAGIHWVLPRDTELQILLLNHRYGDGIPDTSGTLNTIAEETDDQINDEVVVDATLEDISVPTASESDDQVVSMKVVQQAMLSLSLLGTI